MEILRLLNTGQMLAQIASFLILFFILRVFLWKRFLGVLDARRRRIAAELRDIENAKNKSLALVSEYEAKLADIENASRRMIQDAVAEGRRLADNVKQNAQREAELILENAKTSIKEEISRAREKLKVDIVDLTVDIAGKVIQDRLTEEQDKRIVEDFLNKVNE